MSPESVGNGTKHPVFLKDLFRQKDAKGILQWTYCKFNKDNSLLKKSESSPGFW